MKTMRCLSLLLLGALLGMNLGCSGMGSGETGAAGALPTGGSLAGGDGSSQAGAIGSGGTIFAGGTTAEGGAIGAGGVIATGGSSGAGASVDAGSLDGGTASGTWSMGYYASWNPEQDPISEIEWSGLTHIAMAFYLPKPDGSMTLAGGNSQLGTDLIAGAHLHGVKAIASIGGADSQSGFQKAMASGSVAAFAANLVSLLTTTGYDGIDIDWEPMDKTDEPAVIDIATVLCFAPRARRMHLYFLRRRAIDCREGRLR
jgi:chitinase